MHFAVEMFLLEKLHLLCLAPSFFPLLICILFLFLQMANGESRLVAEEEEHIKALKAERELF